MREQDKLNEICKKLNETIDGTVKAFYEPPLTISRMGDEIQVDYRIISNTIDRSGQFTFKSNTDERNWEELITRGVMHFEKEALKEGTK